MTTSGRFNKGGEGPIALREGRVRTRVESMAEAAAFMSVRLSSNWHVRLNLDQDVRAVVVEDETTPDDIPHSRVQLLSPTEFTPSFQKFKHNDDATATLIGHIGTYDSVVFDRGLVWVELETYKPSWLHFGISAEHGLSKEELVPHLELVPTKVNDMITALLQDTPELPYQG